MVTSNEQNYRRKRSRFGSFDVGYLERGDIKTLRKLDAEAHGSAWSVSTFESVLKIHNGFHLVGREKRFAGLGASGDIVAHAGVFMLGDRAHVSNVAVASRARCKGYGSAMVARLLYEGVKRFEPSVIVLEVRAGNRPAQRLYRKFGFAPVAVMRDFYEPTIQGTGDALMMELGDPCSQPRLARIEYLLSNSLANTDSCQPPSSALQAQSYCNDGPRKAFSG